MLLLLRLNRSVALDATVMVVKLKTPLVGKLRMVSFVTLRAPSAPVLPELNCARPVRVARSRAIARRTDDFIYSFQL